MRLRGSGEMSRASRLYTAPQDAAIREGVIAYGVGKWTAIQQGAECLAEFTAEEISASKRSMRRALDMLLPNQWQG